MIRNRINVRQVRVLFFGHAGITTGIVKVCQTLSTTGGRRRRGPSYRTKSGGVEVSGQPLLDEVGDKTNSIDYRFVLLGSLLPDLIDKPMWIFTDANFQWAGRGYAHTFLFNLLLLIAGLILATRRNKPSLLTICLCSFIHLVFDQMWLSPITLWWPLLGPIPRGPTEGWFSALWHGLISTPYVYVSEVVGFVVVLYVIFRLLASGKALHFLKTGHIDLRQPHDIGSEAAQQP